MIRRLTVFLGGVVLARYCCVWAGATLVTVEPDDFAAGDALTYAVDGLILTVADNEGKSRFPAEVRALPRSTTSAGSKGFGRQMPGMLPEDAWFFTQIGVPAVLRADFASATDFVAIDVIGMTSRVKGAMHAFDAEGRLLASSIVDLDSAAGGLGIATISRPRADIAYVLIGGYPAPLGPPWNIVALDRLRFNATASSPPGRPWHMLSSYTSSTTTLTVSVEGAGSNSTAIRYEGAWLGWATIDSKSGSVSAIQVAPGRVKVSDFSLQVPLGGGFFVLTESHGIAATITSRGVAVPVAPNGQVLPGGILETIDTGSVSTWSNVPGFQPQVVDYALNPQPLPPGDPASLTTTLAHQDDYGREWAVQLVRPLDSTSVVEANGVTVTVTEVGAIYGSGTISTRSPYGLWLDSQNLPDLPFSDPNPANGIANGILFALGLDAVRGAQIPWFPDPQNPQGWLLDLPATGTDAAIVVETASGLTSTPWNPIAATDISTGDAEIPSRSSGTVRFFGRAPRQFFRLAAESPTGW